MQYQGFSLPIEVIIEEQSDNAPKNIKFVARVKVDPEYSKAYGRTATEALGALIRSFPDFFPTIAVVIDEKKQTEDYSTCPLCVSSLEVDEEYMQNTYGLLWHLMPKSEWTFYCTNEEECGETGSYENMKEKANRSF